MQVYLEIYLQKNRDIQKQIGNRDIQRYNERTGIFREIERETGIIRETKENRDIQRHIDKQGYLERQRENEGYLEIH